MLNIQERDEEWIFQTIDGLVSENSLYRAINRYVDWSFIYPLVKDEYSTKGRPSIDPVNIFKIHVISILEGFNSVRKTMRHIQNNIEFRWFLNLPFSKKVPDHSSLSQVYKRKFKGKGIYEYIFSEILNQIENKGLIDTKYVYIDGTHIKADANKKKFDRVMIEKPENAWSDEIMSVVNELRAEDGKKPFEKEEPKMKEIKVSTSDPDCGYFCKGEKEKQMAYVAQVVCDNNGYALDLELAPGNVHDSQSCKPILERVLEKYKVRAVAADAGYKTGPIANLVFSYDALFFTAYKRPMTKKGYFKSYEFVYNHEYNDIICPNDKILKYTNVTRNGYKVFKAKECDCSQCDFKFKCTTMKAKQVNLSVYHDVLDEVEHMRHSDEGKEVYKLRKEKIERLFGDVKENHGMRYLKVTSMEKARNQVLLTLTCLNIKKMALHLGRRENSALKSVYI